MVQLRVTASFNMTNGSNGEQRTSKGFDILLPSADLVVQCWKVKEGSLVRKGETVALACPKDTSKVPIVSAPPHVADSSSAHKRPNRRKRAVPSAAVSAPALNSRPGSDSGKNLDAISSIQQRIAEKLSSEKILTKDDADSNRSSDSNATSTLAVTSALSSSSSSSLKESEYPVLAPATGILRTSPNPESTDTPSPRAIGYIEECLHPAFLEGICVVCGESITRQEDGDDEGISNPSQVVPVPLSDSDNSGPKGKTSQVTVSGGVTMTVSAEESRKMAERDTERLLQQAKLSLVLDLDHTLVHATADPRAQQFHDKDDVRTLRLPMMEGMANAGNSHPHAHMFMQHFVKLRPHIKTFLQSVQPDYELTVYTAGTRQYAEEITIVLCRHLLGSTRDIDDLEQLRYQVHIAEIEFQRIQSLKQSSPETTDDEDGTKKRKNDDSPNGNNTEQPAKKRKKVSFGVPRDEPGPSDLEEDSKPSAKSDHMTKEKLDALKKELEAADELEKKAWELRQKIFGSRVVSRTDVGDLGRDVKSLKRIFPCGGTMAAVVDDREDVWANAEDNSDVTIKGEPPDNLLLVRPYHWQPFMGFADVNNAAGEDLSGAQTGNGEDPYVEKDVQLVWTSRILKGLHRRYYRQDMNNRKTVPELLAQMRSQVLRDTTLVLSGLVPLHKKTIGANAARPPIVRYAQTLGAKVS